jgi:hypothetical protein
MAVNNLSKEANDDVKVIYIKFGSIDFEEIKIFCTKEKIISPHLCGVHSDASKAENSLKCNPRLLSSSSYPIKCTFE